VGPIRAGGRGPPARQLAGPVIVQEYGSTVVVPDGWAAACDDSYNMLLDRRLG
jgi:N-methylhydantoinase A/oxoprolinase/acetone carboxylase beta subunit